jgi:hypothetical protein
MSIVVQLKGLIGRQCQQPALLPESDDRSVQQYCVKHLSFVMNTYPVYLSSHELPIHPGKYQAAFRR